MDVTHDNDDLPLLLVRRVAQRLPGEAEDDRPVRAFRPSRGDRLRPGTAGALIGVVAGAAGLAVIHAMHSGRFLLGAARTGTALGIPTDASVPLAYLAAAASGAVLAAGFAIVTQHLRRFVPLVVWAVVFFASLTMLLLATSSTYGRGFGVSMAPAILAASAVFGFVASFQLPLRRRD